MSAPVVATVQAVVGNVIAVNQDGDIRVLKAGDVLFQGETIKTAPEASITVLYATGVSQTIGADANFTLHLSLLSFLTNPTALADMDPTAMAFRTAMLADSDPKKVFAALHALPHEGSHSAYVRPYIDPAADVNSGYPTQGLGSTPTSSSSFVSSNSPSQPDKPTWDEPMYTPPLTVSAPISFSLNEANLANGSHPDANETTVSQTFSFYAGSDALTHFAFSSDLSYLTTDLNNNASPDIFWVRVSDTQIKGFLDAGHNQLAITLDLQAPASINAWGEGDAQVTVTLSDHLSHAAGNGAQIGDLGAVQVEASDGVDTVTATLLLGVQDDVPTAVNDIGSVTEDGASSIGGNVLDNDSAGADAPKSFASWGSEDGVAIAALNVYGTLMQKNDGSWSYALDNSRASTQALTSTDSHDYVLHYTMQDADGDTSEATLTITIHGTDDSASIATVSAMGVNGTVYEHGLVTHDDSQTTANGSFSISATDGIDHVVIGGTTFSWAQIQAFAANHGVVNTADGILTLTNYSGDNHNGTINYSYTLPAAVSNDNAGYFDDNIALAVNGIGGSSASDNLVIRIMDDTPTATNDSASVIEDAIPNTINGNVLNNDIAGADAPKSFVAWGSNDNDSNAITKLNTYGTLTQNNDGSWSYVLDNSRAATQALTSADSHDYVLTYTMQDADGSVSSAQLAITVHGADDSASIATAQTSGPDNTVYEHGLVANDGSQTATGTFTVAATDGIANIVIGNKTFTLTQVQAFANHNGTVNMTDGVLTLTNYSGDNHSGTVSYSYILPAAVSNDSTGYFDDNIALAVNGIGGSSASDNLVIRIMDDTPTATNDSASVIEDAIPNTINGNVLNNDSAGADAPKSFVAWGGSDNDSNAIAALNTYGTLTQNNDGSWKYVLDNSCAATQALTSADSHDYVLTYTMQDADGSVNSAMLTITVQGADDSASVATAQTSGPDNTVYEHGLVANDGSQTATGTFTVAATDGIANIVIGNKTFTLTQVQAFANHNGTVNMTDGVLTLTNYNGDNHSGTVSYSYTLSGAVSNDSSGHFDDSTTITVNGIGGTTASDSLVVRVTDDTPSVTVNAGSGTGVNLITTDPASISSPSAVSSSANFSSVFSVTPTYGADGAGSVNTSYALSLLVSAGAASNLTTHSSAIYLYSSGGVITGSTSSTVNGISSANTAFKVSVDSSGVVTLTQYLPLDEANNGTVSLATNLVKLTETATITDFDGSTATNSNFIDLGNHLSFQDVGPTAPTLTLNASVINDETAGVQSTADPNASNDIAGTSVPSAVKTAFDGLGTVIGYAASSAAAVNVTANYGADGAASSGGMTYALNVTNGTSSGVSTTGGTQIFLYNGSGATAGYIVGRVGTEAGATDTPNASGAIAFAFTVDSAGILYLAQYLSLNNPIAGNTAAAYDDQITLASNAVQMVVTLTDADGSTNSSTIGIGTQIGFQDDSPTLGTFSSMVVASSVGSATGSFNYTAGADGLSQFNITGPSVAGVTYTQAAQANGTTTLTAKVADGTTVFTLTAAADSTYTYNLVTPQATLSSNVKLTTLVAGNSAFAETSNGLIEFSTTSGNTINSSTQGFGVNDQRVAKGEQFSVEFHTAGSLGVDDPTTSNPQFVKTVSLNYADVNLGNKSSDNFLTFTWTAVNSSTNQTATGTITISSSAVGSLYVDPGFAFNSLTMQGTDGVSGSGKGVRFLTADYTYYVFPADTTLQFNVAAVDGDGDVSATQTLSVHQVIAGTDGSYTLTATSGAETLVGHGGVNTADYSNSTSAISINLDDSGNASGAPTTFSSPTDGTISGGDATGDTLSGIQNLIGGSGNDYLFGNSSANTLIGGAGDDIINGEGGNDTIIGGKGNDTLTGGTGADTFVWQAGDQGTSASPALDKITDFSMTDGDVLNLSSLLVGATTSNLSNYLSFAKGTGANSGNTILSIDIDGAANGASVTQQITFQGVSMSQLAGGGSNPTSADVITHLLATHQLVVS